jgi:hypothetical protein
MKPPPISPCFETYPRGGRDSLRHNSREQPAPRRPRIGAPHRRTCRRRPCGGVPSPGAGAPSPARNPRPPALVGSTGVTGRTGRHRGRRPRRPPSTFSDDGAHPPDLGHQLLLQDEIAGQAVEAMHDQGSGLPLPQQDEGLGEGAAVSQGAAHPGSATRSTSLCPSARHHARTARRCTSKPGAASTWRSVDTGR